MKEIVKKYIDLLNNRVYRNELTKEEEEELKEHKIVAIYGASDDLMLASGYFDDEYDCWDGGQFLISKEGIHTEESIVKMENPKPLEVIWCPEGESGPAWTYKTDVEHETFNIYGHDGKLYCVGILIDIENL